MRKEYDFSRARRGALVKEPGKDRKTIRLDNDLLKWFKAQTKGGDNYQTLISDALRSYVQEQVGSLERTIRRVIREELDKAA